MDYTFYPYLGIGDLRFGMSPDDIRNGIGRAPEQASLRSPATKTRKEYYVSLGLLVEFDDKDLCSSFTIMRGGKLLFDSVDLMQMNHAELKRFLLIKGYPIVEEDSGLTCDALGLTSWMSDLADEDAVDDRQEFECLFIFRRGHYEYMKALIEASC